MSTGLPRDLYNSFRVTPGALVRTFADQGVVHVAHREDPRTQGNVRASERIGIPEAIPVFVV